MEIEKVILINKFITTNNSVLIELNWKNINYFILHIYNIDI